MSYPVSFLSNPSVSMYGNPMYSNVTMTPSLSNYPTVENIDSFSREDSTPSVVGTTVAVGATVAGLFALAKKGKLGGAAEGWANKAWNTVKGGFDKMSSTVKGWFSKSGDDVAKNVNNRKLARLREIDELGAAARKGDKDALARLQEIAASSEQHCANKALTVLEDGLMDDIAMEKFINRVSLEQDLLNRYGSNFLANLG